MQRNRIITLFILVFILFSLGTEGVFAQTASGTKSESSEKQQNENIPHSDFASLRETDMGVVADVIDPLTLRLKNGQTVHLTGLDYPDLDYYNPGNFSMIAVQILTDMLVGKKIKLYQTTSAYGLMNRMGHKIAQVERLDDGLWVQGAMLSLGLARVRTSIHNYALSAPMLKYEKEARTEKLGLWEIPTFSIHSSDEAENYIGSYQIIEGTIKNVSMKENRVYINFGDNYKKDFTASITPTNRRLFRKAGYDFQNMGGQTIRVRGWVSSYNGAYIEVTHPEQMEIIGNSGKKLKYDPELEKSKGVKADPEKSDGDALPEVDLSEEAKPITEPGLEKKNRKTKHMGDKTTLERATSIRN